MAKQDQDNLPDPPTLDQPREGRGFSETQKRELKELFVEALELYMRDHQGDGSGGGGGAGSGGETFNERVNRAIIENGGPPLG